MPPGQVDIATPVNPWEAVGFGAVGSSPEVDNLRAYYEGCINKWMWLLEGPGLKPLPKKLWGPLSILFENQSRFTTQLREDTLTTDMTLPVRYTLPMIRQIFGRLFATKLCSIQPMPLTSGGVANCYFLKFKRETGGTSYLTTLDSAWAHSGEKQLPKLGKLELTSQAVSAVKDMLAACWSQEAMEDAKAAGIDVEAEMIRALSDEIAREVDQRILGEMMAGAAAGNATWHWTMGGGYVTAKDWYETLGHALVDADALIYALRQESAQYVVAGTSLFNYICKMATFVPRGGSNNPADSADAEPNYVGAEHQGTFMGYWDIWRSGLIPSTMGLIGRYPTNWLNAGYIYMPYIPLAAMPLVYGEMNTSTGAYENRDAWTRNIRTRWGRWYAVKQLFATITISS